MKKILPLFILFFSSIVLHAQSPDEKIAACLNNSDFFTLDEQYTLLKDSIQSPVLKTFSESLLNAVFNRPQKAFASIDSLIQYHQQEIGFDNVQTMLSWKNQLLSGQGEYIRADDELSNFIASIEPYIDSATLNNYRQLDRINKAMRNIPKSELIRLDSDCIIDIELEPFEYEGTPMGTTLFVPVAINGENERFIFDTGCPGGAFISEDFANRHHVKIIYDSLQISGTGTRLGKMGLIDSISIGNMTYKNLTAIIAPAVSAVDSIYKVDAVLGLGIMTAAGEVRILPKEKKIIFPLEQTPLPESGRNILFLSNQVLLKTYSNTERMIMQFDTGNIESDLHYTYYQKHKDEVERTGHKESKISGGFGGVKTIDIYKLPSISLHVGNKDFRLNNIRVNIDPVFIKQGKEDGSLGMSFVTLFDKVTINFDKMFVEVE
ncbi:retropepsin-like aspartic protease [Dysgonomonas sp. ZJ709]|uniref:retropepsin-like aspartic protease n=1 Tax=Dysgonomonas sp. ZJ709 TaxID=2709797 RepID=UPI0013ED1D4F|nr:retropepsin-like aspartic protease [Dysgonomonas sp. ZJ709]